MKKLISMIGLCAILLSCSEDSYSKEAPSGGGSETTAVALSARSTDYNQIEFQEAGNELVITTKGFDPYIFFDAGKHVDIKKNYILSFESFNTTESLPLVIFVGNVLDASHLIEGYTLPRTEGWTINSYDISITVEPPASPFNSIRMRFGTSGGKTFRIRNVILREPTEQEKMLSEEREKLQKEDAELSARLNKYFATNFKSDITSVSASYHTGKIDIRGTISESKVENIGLVEVPMWEDITNLKNPATFIPIESSSFHLTVDREAKDKHDRLLSGWAVVRRIQNGSSFDYTLLSSMYYVNDESIIPREQLSKKIPRSLKGIGGCPLDHQDMDDLGISSVTFNILLDQILYTQAGSGRIPYTYAGKTWYADLNGHLKGLDKDIKIAQQKGWMVSAILLIPVNRSGEKSTWLGKVAHPETEMSAAFSMPNLLSKEGAEAYAATINFLAERYSTEQYGRIHHWIIHNEIQNGFYWSNAGRKLIETYMNLYQKSMRTVHILARQYDPNTKTLISLDHDWNRTGDPRGYKGKDILDLLVKFSKTECNFEWGIAFHPYPQDINNPRTWEDQDATYSYETLYLTPKNLEVLDSWVSQEKVLYNGKAREIQFTEQGLNSPDYNTKTLEEQAAGMAYTWEKIAGMKNVTAYQYHLWADAYEEGGLKLGLRKYYDADGDPLGKKPIWYLYQAYETPEWEKVRDHYKKTLGITDWSEIRYKGIIK